MALYRRRDPRWQLPSRHHEPARHLPDAKMSSRPELVRFSLIRFADWQREKMKKYANYQGGWREEWISDVPWKEGYEPPAPEDVGEPSMRGARAASRHM